MIPKRAKITNAKTSHENVSISLTVTRHNMLHRQRELKNSMRRTDVSLKEEQQVYRFQHKQQLDIIFFINNHVIIFNINNVIPLTYTEQYDVSVIVVVYMNWRLQGPKGINLQIHLYTNITTINLFSKCLSMSMLVMVLSSMSSSLVSTTSSTTSSTASSTTTSGICMWSTQRYWRQVNKQGNKHTRILHWNHHNLVDQHKKLVDNLLHNHLIDHIHSIDNRHKDY